MKTASNVALIGPMGAGKSSIGKRLAKRFQLRFVDADQEIETRTGASIATIFACEGEAGFRARERAALAALLAQDGLLIATGGGAVLDQHTRTLLRERAFVVYLQVDLQAQLARLARDRSRPLLQREDREHALRELARVREPLYGQSADACFDTSPHDCAEAAAHLSLLLRSQWHAAATRV